MQKPKEPALRHQSGNNSRHIYSGHYRDYHLFPKTNKKVLTEFNSYQRLLYERAMFGLGVYSAQEIKDMDRKKRKRIIKVHKRTKRIINVWKQEIIISLSDYIFEKYVPRMSENIKKLVACEPDPEVHCDMDLSKLGIKKKEIVKKLIEEKVLPQNFYELKTAA